MSNGRSLLAALSGLCVSTAKAWGCMWAESSSKRLVPPIPLPGATLQNSGLQPPALLSSAVVVPT